jgi:signal transduction histidine kinase
MVLPREAPPLPPVDLVLRDAVGVPIRTVSVESHMLDAGELGSVAILRDVTEERRQLSELRTFARVVAHDLRQPLAAIVMWVDTLRQELGDRGAGHAAEEGLDHISAATVRMDTLLGDLLAYALARDGNLVVTEFDLQALVDEVVAARLPAEATPPTIQAEVPFQLRGDRALIRQVVDNVVGNSLKYTVEGHPAEIEISGQRTASGYLTMTIADRGIGIPEGQERDDLPRSSTAARGARDGATRAPGWGWPSARRVVERHGGTIAARHVAPAVARCVRPHPAGVTAPGKACCSQGDRVRRGPGTPADVRRERSGEPLRRRRRCRCLVATDFPAETPRTPVRRWLPSVRSPI